jgi:hypothetical protein
MTFLVDRGQDSISFPDGQRGTGAQMKNVTERPNLLTSLRLDLESVEAGVPVETITSFVLASGVELKDINAVVISARALRYGLQYCAQCLAEDREPYFRRRWRVAYCTFCPDHATLLHDRCFRCGSPVAFHRRELGKPLLLAAGPMSICHQCGFDLRDSPGREVPKCSPDTHQRTVALLKSLELNHRTEPAFGFSFHLILHQMCKIIVSEEKTRVKKFICDQLKYEEVHFTRGRIAFELRPLPERHHATELAMWVMLDLRRRLASAWEAKAVRYNHFVRDLDQPPKELMSIVREFNFWMTI